MYAVINSGGKQYRLTEGALIDLERLDGEVGDQVVFDQVLLVESDEAPMIGTPIVDGAQVVGTIVEQGKGDKIVVFKFKRRKMYRRRTGHRQLLTTVKIDSIEPVGSAKVKTKEAVSSAKEEKQVEKKAAATVEPKTEVAVAAKAPAKKTEKAEPTSKPAKKAAPSTKKVKKADSSEAAAPKKTAKKAAAASKSTKKATAGKKATTSKAKSAEAEAEPGAKKSDTAKKAE